MQNHNPQFSPQRLTEGADQRTDLVITRRLIWLYCFMWIFEGVIRKWLLPSLSMQFLLVRDPIVLMIYWAAIRARLFPSNGWLGVFGVLSAVLCIQGGIHVLAGNVPWFVGVYGMRTFVLHFPLIWVVPAVLGRRDIALLGKWVLYMAPFLAMLMVIQFELPKDHWLNAATIKGGSQIGSVREKIRPPAVFSFISGPIHYFALCAAFTIAGFLKRGLFHRWLPIVGVISTLLAMSVSGSRALVLGVGVVVAGGALASVRIGKSVGGMVALGVVVLAAVAVMSRFSVLREGREAFEERWASVDDSSAVSTTGGTLMANRFGNSITSSFHWAERAPIFGFGMGITTNLSVLDTKSGGEVPVEQEWERVIYEVGPITGFPYLLLRTGLAFYLIRLGFSSFRKGNALCFLFGAACFFDLITGNVRQVTSYGYIAVCAGLCLAAYKAFSADDDSPMAEQVGEIIEGTPKARGRGRFAVGGAPVRP